METHKNLGSRKKRGEFFESDVDVLLLKTSRTSLSEVKKCLSRVNCDRSWEGGDRGGGKEASSTWRE